MYFISCTSTLCILRRGHFWRTRFTLWLFILCFVVSPDYQQPCHWLLRCTCPFIVMTSNGNIFRVTGHLCWEFTGPRWRELWCFSSICTWIHDWVNNLKAGDLRRHCAHYDVSVMFTMKDVGHVYVLFALIVLPPTFADWGPFTNIG